MNHLPFAADILIISELLIKFQETLNYLNRECFNACFKHDLKQNLQPWIFPWWREKLKYFSHIYLEIMRVRVIQYYAPIMPRRINTHYFIETDTYLSYILCAFYLRLVSSWFQQKTYFSEIFNFKNYSLYFMDMKKVVVF